jgi:hypothetical protein
MQEKLWLPAVLVLSSFAVITATAICIRAASIAADKTFGVAEENVKTDTFRQSEAYREGLQRDCEELRLAYVRAKTPDEKAAVLSTLRHRVEGAPANAIPADVKELIQ